MKILINKDLEQCDTTSRKWWRALSYTGISTKYKKQSTDNSIKTLYAETDEKNEIQSRTTMKKIHYYTIFLLHHLNQRIHTLIKNSINT